MKEKIYSYLRVGFGLLGLSSIALELIVLATEGALNVSNFFSFFTILSNLFASVFLVYFGLTHHPSQKVAMIRGAVTLYMIMTGVIFTLLLAGLEGVRLTAVPWNNIVLHYVMPIVLAVDWLINPPKNRLPLKSVALWSIFPIIYVFYTLIRGAIVGWYPYPFFNPGNSSYIQVIFTLLIMTVGVLIAAFILRGYALWITTHRNKAVHNQILLL